MNNSVLWLCLPAVGAGLIQGMAGFGMGFVMMIFLPLIFSVGQASAISQSASFLLCVAIAFTYRKHIRWKLCLFPWLFYFPVFGVMLPVAASLDTAFLKPVLGLFLMALSVWCTKFSDKISIRANPHNAFLCAGSSAVIDAFFGLGGPAMVLYFLATTDSNEEYLGTIQAMFSVTCLFGFCVRIFNGQITTDLLPVMGMIITALLVGAAIGSRFVKKVRQDIMKKIVYGVVGIAGGITFVMNVF